MITTKATRTPGKPVIFHRKISNATSLISSSSPLSSSQRTRRFPSTTDAAVKGENENSVVSSSSSPSSSATSSTRSARENEDNHSDALNADIKESNDDSVRIYKEEMKDVEKLSLEELSQNFVEVIYGTSKASTSSPSSKGKINAVFKNIMSSILSPQWIGLALTYIVLKRFRDERDVKLVKEMLSMEEKELNELPVNERRVEIERARLKWRLKQLRKDRAKVKNFKKVEIMITERLKVLNRMKMKQAEAEVKRAEWLERVGDAACGEPALALGGQVQDPAQGGRRPQAPPR